MLETLNLRDRRDVLDIALSDMSFTRCPGGRIVRDGYVCRWCGHDYTEDDKCGLRRRKNVSR